MSVDLKPPVEQVLWTCVLLSSSSLMPCSVSWFAAPRGAGPLYMCDGVFIRLGKNIFLWTLQFWECRFGVKKCVNYNKFEIATNSVNQIFNLNAFLLTIYLVFTYFALCIDYEEDILFTLSKLAEFFWNLVENLKESGTLRSSWSLFFSKSGLRLMSCCVSWFAAPRGAGPLYMCDVVFI